MKKLYDQLFADGDFTGTFEDFKKQYGDANKSKALFNALEESGDYTQDFESFNSQFGFKPVKTEAVATETAPVTAVNEAVDTDLASEDISSESQNNALDIVIDEIAKPSDYYKEKSAELNQNIAEIEKQLNAYEEKGGTIDPRDAKVLQDYKNELAALDPAKIGVKKRLLNAVSNVPAQLEAAWEGSKAGFVDWISAAAGDDAADFLANLAGDEPMDLGPIVLIDPETNEEVAFKTNPDRFKELNSAQAAGEPVKAIYQNTKKEIGEAADEYIIEKFKEVSILNSSLKETGSIIGGINNADPQEFIGGVISAVSSVLTTAVPAALTRGASLFPQIVAPMYTDFNETKAKSKYPDSADPLSELVNNDETEVAIPIALGGISMALEAIGLKGISKQISKSTGKLAPFARLLLTNNKEGLTEVGQYGVENINKSLAEGNSLAKATLDGLKSMATLDALENYAQGFVGAGIISTPSTITKAINGQPGSLKFINKTITELGALQQARGKNKNKAFRTAVDLEIAEKEAKLKEHFTENYYVSKAFNKEQQGKIISILDQKEKNAKTIEELKASFDAGELSSRQYGGAKSALVKNNNKLSSEIDIIKNEVTEKVNLESFDKDVANVGKALKSIDQKVDETIILEDDKDGLASDKFKDFLQKNIPSDIAKLTSKKQNEWIEDNKNNLGGFTQTKEGKEVLIINKAAALKSGFVTTGQHEFLHKLLKFSMDSDPALITNAGKILLDGVKSNKNDKQGIEFNARVAQYQSDLDKNLIDTKTFYEEVLPLYSEAITRGDISLDRSSIQKIKDFFRQIFQDKGLTKLDFNTDQGIINFIVDYNKSFSKGEFKGKLKDLAKGDKNAVSNKDNSKTTFRASKTTLETINALVPGEVTSQEQYFDRKVFNPIYKATEPNGVISNYIKSKSPSKEVAEKTIASVQERLVNYDPTAERKKAGNKQPITFGEFIFANTNFGKLDAKKALFKESEAAKKTTDLDTKEAQGKIAEDDVVKKDRPKFRKLIDSGVLPGFTIKEIGGKLTKVLKVLKSKLDTKVSINKSVSPLIAEIKKAMGKQADIDLKEAMGGKADAKLQKWLLKNKKAVLENMTTTWLMGAIPQAIQKSVGGTYKVDDAGTRVKDSYGDFIFTPNFTSDWQGKTIDREKTSTNKLGKTAGGDIVRRLPNIATALSDADFVGSVLQDVSIDADGKMTSGAPIRGKKESMAKAVAEEISLEVFNKELQNENSEISKAFENNQVARGVVLVDNFVEDITRQSERGTVKFSKTAIRLEVASDIIDGINTEEFKNRFFTYADDPKNKLPLYTSLMDHFRYFPIEGLEIGDLRKIAAELSKDYTFKPFGEIGIERIQEIEGVLKTLKYIQENTKEGLTRGNSYATAQQIYQSVDTKLDEKTIQGLNEGRAAVKKVVEVLVAQGFTGNEIKNIFVAVYSPSGLGGFKGKLNKDGKTRATPDSDILVESDLGQPNYKKDTETGMPTTQIENRGSFMVSVADFEQNFLKGIEMGDKVSTRTDAYTKNFWSKDDSVYNRLDNKGKKEYLQELQEGKKEYQASLIKFIEAVNKAGISPAAQRTLIRSPFAAMDGLGKITSAPRWMPAKLDGTLLGLKDLVKLGFGRKDGKVDKGVFEHTKPANRMAIAAYIYSMTGKKADLDILIEELSDFDTAFITEGMDKGLVRNKLQSLMGLNYVRGAGVMTTRYAEMIQEMNKAGVTFYDAKTNTLLSPAGALGAQLNQEMKANFAPVKTEQKAINNARSNKWSKSIKKIRVFDFDDTLAQTKSSVLYTMPGETAIYHGGSISSIKNITGSFAYFSQDKSQASEYAKGNDGEVNGFALNESDIASEKAVFEVIRELGIQPKAEGWTVDDSRLYELIDDRFEQSFSKSDLNKLTKALASKGIKASRFTDSDLKSGKDTDNIVVFDKKSIKEQGKIDAATFAKDAGKMEAEGAQWDFSEFSKVMDGKKGPLFEVAKIIADKRGTKDVFVLTARPADAAGPIQEFLSELGLDIPLENITGLGNGTPKAKADWVVGKVADGYNDFYFADDHTGNVKAVKDALDTFDVKGKVQVAKVKFSKGLDAGFNSMIQRQKGVESFKEFSKATAKRRGKKTGKWKFFISPSAEDFRGLTQYKFAGKGKQGEADQKFFEESLMDPYFQGVAALESARQTIKEDTKALLGMFKPVKKKLNKLIPNEQYTYDAAVRVYLWNKAGNEIPGLSKRDNQKLNDLVANDPELSAFADGLLIVSKKDSWPEPGEHWLAQTTLSDLNNLTEKTNRKEYLTEFIENVDIVFSEKNLNKVEALYGEASRKAIENAISAMKSGSNSSNQGGDAITSKWTNWVNNSIGTIMFFNRRSAILQTLSSANFINWSDNNPAKAALAFANQPQYWKDFAMIFNSDKLKQRRGGLKSDVQEAEIANAAKNTQDKAGAIVAYILKLGFTPTQIADSFAISLGGASLYRNRVKTYTKQGMDLKDAEAKAFQDFTKLSDEAQQSGDPALVSQQQRSVAGRLILSFQNTTMQYTRLMKKSGQDLVNGRGDAKTHISKILYFGAVQNFLFNALSKTAFALIPGFDEDEEDDKDKKEVALETKAAKILNGMSDSVVRGTGIYGAILTTLKNSFLTWERENEKGFTGDQTKTILELANLSPAIGSKLRKVYSGIQTYQFDKAVIEKHPWSVTIDGRFNPSSTYSILANVASAGLNLPLDRALAEAKGVAEMLDARNSVFQRIALGAGWRTWNVGAKNEEFDLIKAEAKIKKKKEKSKSKSGVRKRGVKRRKVKSRKKISRY